MLKRNIDVKLYISRTQGVHVEFLVWVSHPGCGMHLRPPGKNVGPDKQKSIGDNRERDLIQPIMVTDMNARRHYERDIPV
ncbi:unnamed protein product [Leptosia nina]|uniref:Uncharacterized protein n=1 Tax=Leptosia nina TaxID=320188 RepID=A0AAV1JF89_9NEOP